MTITTEPNRQKTQSQFALDVNEGLSASPKYLSSKYFYDDKGDILFQQIMNLDEYYLTRTEYEIFETCKDTWYNLFNHGVNSFNIVEFGAGDAHKTKVLLNHFVKQNCEFTYVPIDISGSVLNHLKKRLHEEIPDLNVKPIESDYFNAFEYIHRSKLQRNIILFLGSNIGNFTPDVAFNFFKSLRSKCSENDYVLIGIDIKKDPEQILNAYNDSKGVTASFNKNVLVRMNRELDADFNPDDFIFFPTYNPVNGEIRSYLISKKEQNIFIKALNKSYHFKAFEPVFTEISKKYGLDEISKLADDTGFTLVNNYTDQNHRFINTLWKPK